MNSEVSFTRYVKYAQAVAQLGFFSTTISCSILIYLTMFRVKRNFGTYKYLMILFPLFGIFFATLEFVLYPNIYSHNAAYIYYSINRPFGIGKEAVVWLLALYGGMYGFTTSLLSVQFLYRYWAIFYESKIKYFKGYKFLIWIFYSLVFGALWAGGLVFFLEIDEYSENYLSRSMKEKCNVNFSEIAGMALVAYNSDGSLRWLNISCTINMTLIMLVLYTVMLYCAARMNFEMEEKLQMVSEYLRDMHRQFYKTLILQIVTPTLILFLPVIFIIYIPLLNLEADIPTGIFLCALTVYPAMDAIIVMYVVKDYRKAVRNTLEKLVFRVYAWLIKPGPGD